MKNVTRLTHLLTDRWDHVIVRLAGRTSSDQARTIYLDMVLDLTQLLTDRWDHVIVRLADLSSDIQSTLSNELTSQRNSLRIASTGVLVNDRSEITSGVRGFRPKEDGLRRPQLPRLLRYVWTDTSDTGDST
ncbi:hypothetical protein RRG08_004823 [Elysia crispata]|uniref:Uncharacterized protein n=1 Tax=Elysia crispata TaxID=231223 RepID=A0AAE1CSS9_9GAST|nr:hypothetical protein RRG08_004823 [Elysia crispata]